MPFAVFSSLARGMSRPASSCAFASEDLGRFACNRRKRTHRENPRPRPSSDTHRKNGRKKMRQTDLDSAFSAGEASGLGATLDFLHDGTSAYTKNVDCCRVRPAGVEDAEA
jgi:hypothetical protein